MHPAKVNRAKLTKLTDLPNIGPAAAKDFHLLGFTTPQQLVGADALALYRQLCDKTGVVHDPCVLDVFLSVVEFLAGEPPQVWWTYTEDRKKLLAAQLDATAAHGCQE